MLQPHDHDAPAESRKRLLILLGLWATIAVILFAFRSVLLPFASAALIAYLVHPLVTRISRVQVRGRNVPRWVAILVIYALFFVVAYLFFIAMVPQLYRELARISRDGVAFVNSLTPERVHALANQRRGVAPGQRHPRGHHHAPGEPLRSAHQRRRPEPGAAHPGWRREPVGPHPRAPGRHRHRVAQHRHVGAGRRVHAVLHADGRRVLLHRRAGHRRGYVTSLIPAEYAADARLLLERIDRSLSGVVRGQVTICLVNGALTFVGLLLFGVKFAFLLATVATLFSLIPIFGTILSSVPIVLIALSDGFQKGFAILLWIVGIHALEAYFLNPKIMGSAARIHPVIVAFSLIAGEKLFGLVGALFAVPVASIVVACFDYARIKAQPRPGTLVLEPVQPPEQP